jgi:hypothetical protein
MTSFSFRLENDGMPEQCILFTPEGGEPVRIPVPGIAFSEDVETRFHQEYKILVREGLIPDVKPVLNLPDAAQPKEGE